MISVFECYCIDISFILTETISEYWTLKVQRPSIYSLSPYQPLEKLTKKFRQKLSFLILSNKLMIEFRKSVTDHPSIVHIHFQLDGEFDGGSRMLCLQPFAQRRLLVCRYYMIYENCTIVSIKYWTIFIKLLHKLQHKTYYKYNIQKHRHIHIFNGKQKKYHVCMCV